jgi:PAS domain S-box-containing protein
VDNGVDFYIQKGHDMHGMIAELRYKLRRAIERRRIGDELERSRQQMNDIINFLPDATFVRDINGRVIAWNRAMEQMSGVSGNVMLGKADYEYALPLYHERRPLLADLVLEKEPFIDPHLRFFQRDGDKMSAEIHIPHFNAGKGAYLWVTASPLYGSDGSVSGAIESFRDISDYYAIKRDLSLSQAMNQGFADMIPVGIYEMDLGFHLTFTNRVCMEMLGLSQEDAAQTRRILDFIDPSDRERAIRDLKSITHAPAGSGQEYLLQHRNKRTFPGLIYGGLITDPDTGRPVGIRGVIIDLSERKQAARELQENRELLELALTAGSTGIWDVDMRTMTVHDIRKWANQVLGYHPDDLPVITINTCKNLVHPLDMPGILLAFFSHVSGKAPLFESEFRLAAKDRSWKNVAVRGKIIERGPDNTPIRITGVINLLGARKNERQDGF